VVSCPATSGRAENPSDIAALNPIPFLEEYEREQAAAAGGGGDANEHAGKARSPSMLALVRDMLGQVASVFNTTEFLHIGETRRSSAGGCLLVLSVGI
jgi:hypothetical protein